MIYVPLLQRAFATEADPFADRLLVIGTGTTLFAHIETEKQNRLPALRAP